MKARSLYLAPDPGPMNDVEIPDGLTPEAYEAEWRAALARPLTGLDRVGRRYAHYRRYNHERAARVRAAYEPSAKLRRALDRAPGPQRWFVLTEDWCADSAFSLPVFEAAAALSDEISLRILPRDDHPEIMDRFLTDGKRSIPKLFALDADDRVLFTWGPRPAPAAKVRAEILAATDDGRRASAALMEWYEGEGWLEVERELAAALEALAETHDERA